MVASSSDQHTSTEMSLGLLSDESNTLPYLLPPIESDDLLPTVVPQSVESPGALPTEAWGSDSVSLNLSVKEDLFTFPSTLPYVSSPCPPEVAPYLPHFGEERNCFLDLSIVAQLDALIYAVFRSRLERDVCAISLDQSYCMVFGKSFSPLSSECSLFFISDPVIARRAVEAAIEQKATALFVVKDAPFDGRVLPPVKKGDPSLTWFMVLKEWGKKFLSFDFSGRYCRPSSPSLGIPFAPLVGFLAFFVSFRSPGYLKRHFKRPERKFTLTPFSLDHVPRFIGIVPFGIARCSHSVPFRRPTPGDDPLFDRDLAPTSSSVLRTGPDVCPAPPSAPVWNVAQFVSLSRFYPFQDVAAIAREGVSAEGYDVGFAGDPNKCVISHNRLTEADIDRIRSRLIDESLTVPPRMAGPFSRIPFPCSWNHSQCRTCPVRCEPKDKYDPLSDRFRLVSNFSKHEPSSVNDLCFNPKLIELSYHARFLMAELTSLGPRAQVFALDIQKAYRYQRTPPSNLHLAVYMLSPREYFIDFRHPFGWRTAQFVYQAIAAVLVYGALTQGITDTGSSSFHSVLRTYVDNFFLLSQEGDPSHAHRAVALRSLLESLNLSLHEFQDGPVFEALGWIWDTESQCLECPVDKFIHLQNRMSYLASLVSSSSSLPRDMADSLLGFLNWLSVACPVVRLLILPVRLCVKRSRAQNATRVPLDRQALHSVLVASEFFRTWKRRLPFFQDFSPLHSWEYLVRTDGSTSVGAGGVVYPGGFAFSFQWSQLHRRLLWGHISSSLDSGGSDVAPLSRESSGVGELLSLLFAVRTFGPLCRKHRVLFELDSESMESALSIWFSEKPHVAALLDEIYRSLISFEILPRFRFIPRLYNRVSDSLSTDDFAQADSFARLDLGLCLHRVPCSPWSPSTL